MQPNANRSPKGAKPIAPTNAEKRVSREKVKRREEKDEGSNNEPLNRMQFACLTQIVVRFAFHQRQRLKHLQLCRFGPFRQLPVFGQVYLFAIVQAAKEAPTAAQVKGVRTRLILPVG